MNRKASFKKGASVLWAAVVALALAVIAITAGSGSAQAGSGGLAYDELVKINMSGMSGAVEPQAPPQPGAYTNGSFEGDFKAAVDAAATPKPHGGMFGAITNAMEAGKSALNIFKYGTASTHYFWNGLEREDDPAHQTATITRGDLHQIIHLDLAKKTYSITDMNARMPEGTPPPYTRPGPQGPEPSPVPGTAKVAVSASTSALGPKVLDNVPTDGYKVDFKVTSSEATGSCVNGTFGTTMIEYVSKYDEPTVTRLTGPVHKSSVPVNPETSVLRPGCRPKFTARTHMGPTAPGGKLAMWAMVNITAGMQTTQGQAGGGFGSIIERGNVRTLGPSDKSLFEIPAGFTKVDTSSQ